MIDNPSPSDIRQEDVREALALAVKHIEHMAAFITNANSDYHCGTYSFESLGEDMPGIRAALSAQTGEPDWKFNCLSALKLLHEALDVIEDIDSECLLPGQLKDRVDAALAPRQNAEPPYASPPPDTAPSPLEKHTPTPWRIGAGDDYYIAADGYPAEFIGHFKEDDLGPYVAYIGNRPKDFGEANAAYIVKACNAYPEMIVEIERLRAALSPQPDTAPSPLSTGEVDK